MADKTNDELITPENDTRNVRDDFKGWPVESIATELRKSAFPFHIAIENYQHDYNIGTIVRSANAFNVSGVHIIGKRHWNKRGAMATEKYLQVYHHASVAEFIAWAAKEKLQVIGIDNIASSTPLTQAELPRDSVLVFGQEGPGLSEEMQNHCQQIIAIEQFGSTRSVNVGVAAGIIMYEWVRRNAISKMQNSGQ
jgi:tRNA G18 (ribose-2'-O)-methylase SpoU